MISSQKGWVVGSLNCPPYIAYTSDGGVTWETQVSVDGFQSIFMIDEEEGWACGDFGILYHTTTGGVTWVREVTETPVQYVVLQNYPDPFNPSTTFSFSIPHASIVKLAVFDLLGREVAVLVDRKLEPGSHTARWDAAPMPSGVYLARLSVGGTVVTKKLVRVR
jgi:hypothetical protein